MAIEEFPRVKLANLPTPLVEAPRLSAALGGPRILIKRDDLTGLAMGGNKARKLEFVLADAKAKGVDVLITTGSSQSNFAVQMAAAGHRLGMVSILVLFKGQHSEVQGNYLLNRILGAEVRIMDVNLDEIHKIEEAMLQLADELRRNGRNPYVIPAGADIPLGCIGYTVAVQEIAQQLNQLGITADYICDAAGGGGTHVGLVLGTEYYKLPLRVIGISHAYSKEVNQNNYAGLFNTAASWLQMGITKKPGDFEVFDDYLGDGYGIPTKECIEAIKLVARTEGIFLDPVYTGKTMSGLIDLIRKGRFTSKDTVIFLHTGGVPAIFAYQKEILNGIS